uniref:UspA domain-containing protein n=1 Tax=Aegilops tauschii subsp. strangulata TaxID=200361 RepID=A0A453I8Z9_AEGTS
MDPAEGRRILVAVDEGDESVHALRWCLTNFATRGDGELAPPDTILLLYVRPTPPTYSVLDASGTYVLSSGSDPTLIPASGTNRPAP